MFPMPIEMKDRLLKIINETYPIPNSMMLRNYLFGLFDGFDYTAEIIQNLEHFTWKTATQENLEKDIKSFLLEIKAFKKEEAEKKAFEKLEAEQKKQGKILTMEESLLLMLED